MDRKEKISHIRTHLLSWFGRAARDLAWRRTRDPYRVWLSEIMLQQTRVAQAEDYYDRFVARYPRVEDLAAAELGTVLRDWEGLGYYARARNVHRAARLIVNDHDGTFPSEHADVLSLPGVGPYTAAAVMSIAYGEPFAAVDGNVLRVLSRLFELSDDPRTAAGKKRFQQLAEELLDRRRPGEFNEAMMELGATTCLPRNPRCRECPVVLFCGASNSNRIAEFPSRRRRRSVPHHQIAVAVIVRSDGRLFIQRRPVDGLLGGLWEFPGGKIEAAESPAEACRREAKEELAVNVRIVDELDAIDHAYSHFTVTLLPFACRIASGAPRTRLESRWVRLEELDDYAFPRANRRLIELLMQRRTQDLDGPKPAS